MTLVVSVPVASQNFKLLTITASVFKVAVEKKLRTPRSLKG